MLGSSSDEHNITVCTLYMTMSNEKLCQQMEKGFGNISTNTCATLRLNR